MTGKERAEQTLPISKRPNTAAARALVEHAGFVQGVFAVTGAAYKSAWVQEAFWRIALDTTIVCILVATIALMCRTLGCYALARST
jgi:ABC-type glycerol-3-phosphate transport system permease component